MKDAIFLLFNLLSAITKLIQPGGSRAVIAENLLLKQQLITPVVTLKSPTCGRVKIPHPWRQDWVDC